MLNARGLKGDREQNHCGFYRTVTTPEVTHDFRGFFHKPCTGARLSSSWPQELSHRFTSWLLRTQLPFSIHEPPPSFNHPFLYICATHLVNLIGWCWFLCLSFPNLATFIFHILSSWNSSANIYERKIFQSWRTTGNHVSPVLLWYLALSWGLRGSSTDACSDSTDCRTWARNSQATANWRQHIELTRFFKYY